MKIFLQKKLSKAQFSSSSLSLWPNLWTTPKSSSPEHSGRRRRPRMIYYARSIMIHFSIEGDLKTFYWIHYDINFLWSVRGFAAALIDLTVRLGNARYGSPARRVGRATEILNFHIRSRKLLHNHFCFILSLLSLHSARVMAHITIILD